MEPVVTKPERRERNAVATRARLLDAAEHEFAARGFQGARLREIADAAGVQPALIHHYFADKQGLYRAVLDRGLLTPSVASFSILESERDLEGLVTRFVDMLVHFYAAHHQLLAVLRHEAGDGSSILKEVCRERTVPVVEAVKALLIERQRTGEVRADVDAEEIIMATMSMVVHPFSDAGLVEAMMPGYISASAAALEKRKRAIVALVLGGIRA
jgi:TetR/AcrR family transcriptional regulator